MRESHVGKKNLVGLSAGLLGAFTLTLGVDFAGEWAVGCTVNWVVLEGYLGGGLTPPT